jgi:ABC-type multidrug transport system permease subunit
MKEIVKNNIKPISLALAYTLAGILIYGYLFNELFHLWYITLVVILVIIAIGSIGGILYVKSQINEQKKANLVEN